MPPDTSSDEVKLLSDDEVAELEQASDNLRMAEAAYSTDHSEWHGRHVARLHFDEVVTFAKVSALCATVRALRAGGLTMQAAYDKATGDLKQENTALREQLAQAQAEVEGFSILADEKRDAQVKTWDEFVAKFKEKYPRLPLYDTENCKRYVQRAVKFITRGYIDD